MKGAKGSQDHFRAQEGQPPQPTPNPTWWEPKGAKTTAEPKKAATPTNTKAARSKVALRTLRINCLGKLHQRRPQTVYTSEHPPHEGRGANGNQHPTPHQSPRRRPYQPTPTPKWRERKGANTTSEPKKAATPTNTKAARSKVALRTPTVNCLGKKWWSCFQPKHLTLCAITELTMAAVITF